MLPLASAGYAATYEAHVASEAAAPPAGTLALMNHLPHPAVLCRTDSTGAATGEAGAAAAADGGAGARNAAGAASEVQLDCALGVPAREFIELEHGSLRVLNSTRSASSARRKNRWRSIRKKTHPKNTAKPWISNRQIYVGFGTVLTGG